MAPASIVARPGSWAIAADAVVDAAELGRDVASWVAGWGVAALSSSMVDCAGGNVANGMLSLVAEWITEKL